MNNVIPFPQPEPAGEWPQPSPLPSTLSDVMEFEPKMLPAELRSRVVDIAERMQVPVDFVAVPAMILAGGLLGSRIGIRPQQHGTWTEVCNLWGCIVGSPGVKKSPAIAEALAPLRMLEAEAAIENDAAVEKHGKAMAFFKLEKEAAEQRARKELKSGATAVAAAIMDELNEPHYPPLKRYLTTDATVEKLGAICADNPHGIVVHRDELLTLFSDLDREENAAARGFYLSAWGGTEHYTCDRIGRGRTHVPTLNLSLIGTTQPTRLPAYLRSAFQRHDDGMAQRLQLLCWPDLPKWKPIDREPDAEAKAAAIHCYRRLATIDPSAVGAVRDRDDHGAIPYLRFTTEAQFEFDTFMETLETRLREDDRSPQFVAHLSKFRGLVARISLIYHLASGGSGPVPVNAVVAALVWAEYLESHATRAYGSAFAPNTDVANAILRRIRKGDLHNGFTARDVYRQGWTGLADREQVTSALKLLEDYDWLKSEQAVTGGRPSVRWWINPAVLP